MDFIPNQNCIYNETPNKCHCLHVMDMTVTDPSTRATGPHPPAKFSFSSLSCVAPQTTMDFMDRRHSIQFSKPNQSINLQYTLFLRSRQNLRVQWTISQIPTSWLPAFLTVGGGRLSSSMPKKSKANKKQDTSASDQPILVMCVSLMSTKRTTWDSHG